MTVKGGTTPACAACKYQRRRCTATCPLAPYFPATHPKTFQNVHRLFGVSNITKTLKSLKTKDQKDDAMTSIIYEAEMRERFPVHGCNVILSQLRLQLQYKIEELKYVYSQLAVYREQLNKPPKQPLHGWEFENHELITFNVNQNLMNGNNGLFGEEGNMEKKFMGLDSLSNSLTSIQTQMDSIRFHDKQSLYQNYEALPFNRSDDSQSYVETKEVCQSSSESASLKDTPPLMARSELRNAAADLSLHYHKRE